MERKQKFIGYEDTSESEHLIETENTNQEITPSFRIKKTNGPWTRGKIYTDKSLLINLHEELIDFYNYMHATPEEHQIRVEVIERISALSKEMWALSETYPYGSFTTDLYLPFSDVDIVILNVSNNCDPVNTLAEELRNRNMVSHIETIASAKIPIIKCTDRATGIKVDICFGVTAGLETAKLVQAYLAKWSVMRPLVFFLKYFLQWRRLNDTYQGGVGSFMLQLMVVSMIQLHPMRMLGSWLDVDKEVTLGAWLLSFFELYGKDFNYSVVGISVSGHGRYYKKKEKDRFDESRPYLLSIENPLDINHDIGRNSFAIMRVRKSFEYAYHQLLLRDDNQKGVSLLSRIVSVRDEHLKNRGGK